MRSARGRTGARAATRVRTGEMLARSAHRVCVRSSECGRRGVVLLAARVMRRALASAVFGSLLMWSAPAVATAQQSRPGTPSGEPQATFRSTVEAVTVTAAVRDGRGRVVQGLKQTDFEVFDTGQPAKIRDFYVGESPISLAVLLDISGSMAVGGNMNRAREAVNVATLLLRDASVGVTQM